MRAALYLTLRRLRHEPLGPLLLIGSLALAMVLPLATRTLIARLEVALTARANATPAIAGSAGSALDLVLAGLYFREAGSPPVSAALWDELVAAEGGVAVPVLLGASLRGVALVGTAPEYFEQRGLVLAEGDWPLLPGEVLLGAEAALALGLGVGDRAYSDQRELYDLSVPQALRLTVVGLLEPSGGPDDRAAFADVVTIWAISGVAHGHTDADEIDDAELLLAELEDGERILSPALVADNDPSRSELTDFHLHGDRSSLPLTAVLHFPSDERARVLLTARIDERPELQMVAPRTVVDDLLGRVFRVRELLDLFALALALTTLALGTLVLLLSTRLRAAEFATLDRIGAAAGTRGRSILLEIALELGIAAVLAAAGLGLLNWLVPDPTRWL
jgi:putative ABC transport system permease protein